METPAYIRVLAKKRLLEFHEGCKIQLPRFKLLTHLHRHLANLQLYASLG